MTRRWPQVEYIEEGMREGMQIESASIPVENKVKLLDALSETGLKRIVVGSFVSPKFTPQMTQIEELLQHFRPKAGVQYNALVLNQQGVERAKFYSPPLTVTTDKWPRLMTHMCDVFARRNTNRSQFQEISNWPKIVAQAQERGTKEAGIGVSAAWGSNFLGDFPVEYIMSMLAREHGLWDEAGIDVTSVYLFDPMSWCVPHKVEDVLTRIKEIWPQITHFKLHLHHARGMAVASAYAALRALEPSDHLELDGTIGGMGGCPYCGNGQVTAMCPTEDLIHMFEAMGIEMGVDLDKVIECVWMAEEMVGRPLYGHVSKAGVRPNTVDKLFDMNMPFVETPEQALHWKYGPKTYDGGIYPWREPIQSPYRDRVESGLPAYEPDGEWPWNNKEVYPI